MGDRTGWSTEAWAPPVMPFLLLIIFINSRIQKYYIIIFKKIWSHKVFYIRLIRKYKEYFKFGIALSILPQVNQTILRNLFFQTKFKKREHNWNHLDFHFMLLPTSGDCSVVIRYLVE